MTPREGLQFRCSGCARAEVDSARRGSCALVVLAVLFVTVWATERTSAADTPREQIESGTELATDWSPMECRRLLGAPRVAQNPGWWGDAAAYAVFAIEIRPDAPLLAALDPVDVAAGVAFRGTGNTTPVHVAFQRDAAGMFHAELPDHLLGSSNRDGGWTVSAESSRDGGPPKMWLTRRSYRRGDVAVGGLLRPFAFVDADADGRFDGEQDRIVLDVDGDGRLRAFEGSADVVRAGDVVRIANAAWKLGVDDGTRLTLTPSVDAAPAPSSAWPPRLEPLPGTPWPPETESLGDLQAALDAGAPPSTTLRRIGALGTHEAFEALRSVATDPTRRAMRTYAVIAMGAPNLPGADEYLLRLASADADRVEMAAAIRALYLRGGARLEDLLDGWVLDECQVRGALAAQYLALIGTPHARELAVGIVLGSGPAASRRSAYLGLRELGVPPPRDVVLAAARSDDPALAADGIDDLFTLRDARWRDAAVGALARDGARSLVARIAALLLSDASSDSVVPLLDYVRRGGDTYRDGSPLAVSLHRLRSDPAIASLTDALDDESIAVRRFAAEALAGVASEQAAAALTERLLVEQDDDVRVGLGAAIARLAEDGVAVDGALPELRRRATSGDWALRAAALESYSLAAQHDPWLAETLDDLLRSKARRPRICALDAISAGRLPGYVDDVVQSLSHPDRAVRVAAAQCLARICCRKDASPLVDALERERHPQVRREIVAALTAACGIDVGENVASWRDIVAASDDAVFPAPTSAAAPGRYAAADATFYGVRLATKHVAFVMDGSGSMLGTTRTSASGDDVVRWADQAREELRRCLRALGSGARVNVTVFAEAAASPWNGLRSATQGTIATIESFLDRKLHMPTASHTDISSGLAVAFGCDEVEEIVLLSDGSVNAGRADDEESLLRWVARQNRFARVPIHCVAFGSGVRLMRRLAEQTGGQHIRI